ncbi:MAG: sugar phosphate isomerase/epimerase family protein [Bryobacteraceae bacterium]
MPHIDRRTFLAAAGAAALASPGAADSRSAVRLGGPIFLKSDDPAELAREHRRLGYSAAYCPQAKATDTARVRAIEKAFAAENVIVAEVGAWVNMLDPDTDKRRANLQYVVERMALAEALGAHCCVDIAGSYNPDVWYGPNPKNLSQAFFDATVDNCRHVIDEIKPVRSKFTIEAMGWSLPDGPDSYLKLIRAVDRAAFGVHLDVCNVINSPERFYRNSEVIEDCFRKLGRWIVSCHAKDLKWIVELNVHFQEVIPGRGQIDYKTYLNELARLPAETPLMLEHLKTAGEYEEGARYIREVAAAAGVSLG